MEVKKISDILEELNLNLTQLSKKNKDGKVRGQVFIDKIKDGEEFVFNKEGQVKSKKKIKSIIDQDGVEKSGKEIEDILSTNGDYDELKSSKVFKRGNYVSIIKSDDDQIYKLIDIEKTADFGSSGGASLGTKNTRIVESIQCIYLSLRQFKNTNLRESEDIMSVINSDNSDSILDFVSLSKDLNFGDFEEFLISWNNTFYRTANALYSVRSQLVETKERVSILDPNKKYIFNQIASKSNLIESIIEVYKKCEKEIPISKWTPSDIWAVNSEKESEIIQSFSEVENMEELNNLINSLFNSKDLIGISLKKINTSDEQLNLIINNETPKPLYVLENISITENPTKTINTTINAQRFSNVFGDGVEKLDIRSFSGPEVKQDISGEVIGKDARQGRIGLKHINSILNKYGVEEIPFFNEILFNKTADQLIDELNELNLQILNKYNIEIKRDINYNTDISIPRLLSKYQGLLLSKRLIDNSEKTFDFIIIGEDRWPITKADKILHEILYYALSIQNSKFISPKYVRVI